MCPLVTGDPGLSVLLVDALSWAGDAAKNGKAPVAALGWPLRASFRPPGFICAIRSLWRHRGRLIQILRAENIRSRGDLYRVFGVDLTNVPGISAITAQTILYEIGTDVSGFRNASAFASWLGLCPEKKISGGKVLFTKSRRVRSRLATALRMGAQSLHHAKDYLGEFSGVSRVSSAGPRQSQPRRTNSLAFSSTS